MIRTLTVLLVLGIVAPALAEYPEMLPGDPRMARSASSPEWLAAVGRLVNTKSATEREQCTLSVVVDDPRKDGVIGVTAGHCVDHWYRGDGSFDVGDNSVTFRTQAGSSVTRRIVEVLEAETHKGDYAIVRLDAPISRHEIPALLNAPLDYTDAMDEEWFGEPFEPFATVAGYSADTGLGQRGTVLTYHERCQLNGGTSGMKKGYCYSYEGASGGPVVVTVDLGEFNDLFTLDVLPTGTLHLFVGTVIGSRAGDNHSKTMWTDTTHYTRLFDRILAEH